MKTIVPTCLVETESASCSGIIIDAQKGYIVTHATILLPYLANRFTTFKRLLKENHLSGDVFEDLNAVHVTFEQRYDAHASDIKQQTQYDFKTSRGFTIETINLVASGSNPTLHPSRLIKQKGQIKHVWRSDRFANTLKRLFPTSEWKFIEDLPRDDKTENAPEISKDQVYHLLPCFVLIEVGFLKDSVQPVKKIIPEKFKDVAIGTEVLAVATPFGNLSPEVFLNSVSSGIISNLAGERQEMILTDARCIPGSEGGAIYERSHLNSYPIGMIISPLCWKANEWVGLAIGCRINEILASLKKSFRNSLSGYKGELNGALMSSPSYNPFENVPVVLVDSGATWGSGVLINQTLGIVVTCSHVVNGKKEVKVRIDVPHVAWYKGEIVYATANDQVFDIAILYLKDFQPVSCWPKFISTGEDIAEGTEVFVVGHAAFGQESQMKPTVTHGVISKILFSRQTPVIIQMSCSVNSGASGGAVINKNGQLLGIVVCNARDKECGATYPHLNLSIPAATVWPAINRYMESRKVSDLASLTLNDPRVKLLWTLRGSEAKLSDVTKSKL